MKITSVVTLVAALSGANAFSPASSNSRPSVLKAVDVSDGSELENMIGADVETGGRIVSWLRMLGVECTCGPNENESRV